MGLPIYPKATLITEHKIGHKHESTCPFGEIEKDFRNYLPQRTQSTHKGHKGIKYRPLCPLCGLHVLRGFYETVLG
jgi:hypothetical protein